MAIRQHAKRNETPHSTAFGVFQKAGIATLMLDQNFHVIHANDCFNTSFEYFDTAIWCRAGEHSTSLGNAFCVLPYLNSLQTRDSSLSVETEFNGGLRCRMDFARGSDNTLLLCLQRLDQECTQQQSLEQINRALFSANREIAEFSHAASHDLRSPLRALRTIPHWINSDLRDAFGEVPAAVQQHIELLEQQSLRLEKMLDALMLYASIGTHQEAQDAVSVQGILGRLRDEIELPPGFELELELQDQEQQLLVPASELRLVLDNLVENALLHHHRDAGRVTISTARVPDSLIISVMDDGPGIPERHHQAVLKIFSTLVSRDTVEGSGMGLAIARKIVNQWQGELQIDTGDDTGGTRISLFIPASRCKP